MSSVLNASAKGVQKLTPGADGAMTGFPCPERMVEVRKAHAAGDIERPVNRQTRRFDGLQ